MSSPRRQFERAPDADRAAAGAIGGSKNEQGAHLRARVGALLAISVIERSPVANVGLSIPDAIGFVISAESDDPVDDLVLDLQTGGRIFVQSKLKAGLGSEQTSGTREAMRQFARAVQTGLRHDDWLVLATADPVNDLRALGELVENRRYTKAGAPTRDQASGVRKLRAIAADYLPDDKVDELLRHLVIWRTDPTQADGEAALLGGLKGTIVEPDHARTGAEALTEVIRTLARKRVGLDAMGLVDELRRRKVPLRHGASPESTVAQVVALSKHRDREVRHGSTLRLFGAPPELADVTLADADARVTVLYEDARTGDPLERILRRLGRVLLVGEPGGGKSTALAAMSAHWAARPGWPVPIRAHLQRLVDATSGISHAVLDAATVDLLGDQRAALRAALTHKLLRGETLIILDGVDEIGEARLSVLEDLRRWISELPEGNEILVATRPSTERDGEVLGLQRLTLQAPDYPRHTAQVITEAAAPTDSAVQSEWIDTRVGWLTQAFDRDPSLEHTPLMAVRLALIAALSQAPGDLPTSRAEILSRSLFDAVAHWDVEQRARGRVRLGGLAGTEAREGVSAAMVELCRVAIEKPGTDQAALLGDLSDLFATQFGLEPARARSSARDSLDFWLTTGLFSLETGSLIARVRPLAEAGVATAVALASDTTIMDWVTRARRDRARWDLLAIAAGLSPVVANCWIEEFALDGSVDELIEIADAISDGVFVDHEGLVMIVARGKALLQDNSDAERVAETIIALPLADEQRGQLREVLLNAVPPDRRPLVEALIVTCWQEAGQHADDVLRALIAEVPPDVEPQRGDDGILRIESSYVDGPHRDVYESAARRLVERGRSDAELVVEHKFAGSLEHHHAVRSALEKAGHPDLAAAFEADWHRKWQEGMAWLADRDFDGHTERLLATIASLSPPALLGPTQVHRMDDLASFFTTAGFGGFHSRGFEDDSESVVGWSRAVGELGGFDLRVLSAEAAQLINELSDDVEDHLFPYQLGEDRNLTHWQGVADVEQTRSILVGVLGRMRSRDHRIEFALHAAPTRERAIPLLEQRLERARGEVAETLAWTILLCAPDADQRAAVLLDCEDPMMRIAAAMWSSLRQLNERLPRADFLVCIIDEDENVRSAALALLKADDLSEELRERVAEVKGQTRCAWQCRHCGTHNTPQMRACAKCETTGPDAGARARDLLEKERSTLGHGLRLPQQQRRVRRRSGSLR